jgi:hypothetical protein
LDHLFGHCCWLQASQARARKTRRTGVEAVVEGAEEVAELCVHLEEKESMEWPMDGLLFGVLKIKYSPLYRSQKRPIPCADYETTKASHQIWLVDAIRLKFFKPAKLTIALIDILV